MQNSSSNGWWILAILIVCTGLGLSAWRLHLVPDVGATLSADLVVRESSDQVMGTDPQLVLTRGDRLTALAGHQVQDLPDVMSLVRNLRLATRENPDSHVEYQAVRPLHRFTLTLRGTELEPGNLPLGVEPTDRLVEVDGRALPGKVGPEGIKSIVASRPEAVLSFERQNAVFSGRLPLHEGPLQSGHFVVFATALLLIGIIGKFRNRRIGHGFAASVAVQTAFLSFVGLIILRPLWVQADLVLGCLAVAGFVLPRPVAYLGRASMREQGVGLGAMLSAGLAAVGATSVMVLITRGVVTTELGLQFAAIMASLYIIYELVAGFARQSSRDLGSERGIFLTGIVVLSVAAGIFAYLSNPNQFVEHQWVPFSVTVLGLMWFGDAVLCMRGPATTGLDEILTEEVRQQRILDYFDIVAEQTGPAKFRLVLFTEERSVAMGLGLTGFEVSATDQALHDALSILVREGAQVPSAMMSHEDPLVGIANTMQMSLATRLAVPESGVEIPRLELVLVAFGQLRPGENFVPAPVSATEVAHKAMVATTWASALLEGLPYLSGESVPAPAEPSISPQVVDELRARVAQLEEERQELRGALEVHAETIRVLGRHERLANRRLLEPELIEALQYLLETDEPIVINGPSGAGKEFVARFAASIDTSFVGPVVMLDAVAFVDSEGFSDVDDMPVDVIHAAAGGALIVRSARLLDPHQVKAVLHHTAGASRLYLLYDLDVDDSAIADYPDELASRLEHREMVLPGFSRRKSIMSEVIQHLVERAALRQRKDVLGIAAEAMRKLEKHPFPGHIAECEVMVEAAVARAHGDILEVQDFPGL